MIELEKTYLVKFLPPGLENCKKKEVFDIYIPQGKEHPTLRIRKNGTVYEITKKEPIHQGDSSTQQEQTILLREDEFRELQKLDGKKVRKMRYMYPYHGMLAEVDVFLDALLGLILVDFEFDTHEDKDAFHMPDFCLAEVTQEKFTAGGMLCGKSYGDIEKELLHYKYKKIFL